MPAATWPIGMGGQFMLDVAFVGATAAFFAVALFYTVACEKWV